MILSSITLTHKQQYVQDNNMNPVSNYAPTNQSKQQKKEQQTTSSSYDNLFISTEDGYDLVTDGFAVANEEPIATFDSKPSSEDYPDDVDAVYVTENGSKYEVREATYQDENGEPLFRSQGATTTYQYMNQTESTKFKPIQVNQDSVQVIETADIDSYDSTINTESSGSIDVQKLREDANYSGDHSVSSTAEHTFITDYGGDVDMGSRLHHGHWRVDNMQIDYRSGKQAPHQLPKAGFENEKLVDYMDVENIQDGRSKLDIMSDEEVEQFTEDYYEDVYGVEDYSEWWTTIQGLDYDGFTSKEVAVAKMIEAMDTDTYKDSDEQKQDPLRDSVILEDGEIRFGKNVKWTASMYTMDKLQYQGEIDETDGWPDVTAVDAIYARFGREAGASSPEEDLGASSQLSREDAKRVVDNWDKINYDTVKEDLLEVLEDGDEETREYLADLMKPYVMATKSKIENEDVGLDQSVSLGQMPVFGGNLTIYKARHYCNKNCGGCPHGKYRRYAWRDGDTTRTRYVG